MSKKDIVAAMPPKAGPLVKLPDVASLAGNMLDQLTSLNYSRRGLNLVVSVD